MKNAKKTAALALALVLLLALLPGGVSAASVSGKCGDEDSSLRWTLDDTGLFTIHGKGNMEPYTTASSRPWAAYKNQIKTVVVDSGALSIAYCAFVDCPNLTKVTISETVTDIGAQAFFDCPLLREFVVDSKNGSYCSENGILFNKNKTELVCYPAAKEGSYTIPNGVRTICAYSFGYSSVSSVTIPDSVIWIGDCAFSKARDLKSVTIGAKVVEIGFGAFGDCQSLTAINVASGNQKYSSVEGVLYNKDQTTLIQCPGSMTGSCSAPSGVKKIERNAFQGCVGLTEIIIPDGVTEIGIFAFSGCTSLAHFTVPYGLTEIGNGLFQNCTGLQSVTIPATVKSVLYFAFLGCDALTDVYYGGSSNDWQFVSIVDSNLPLFFAELHYNSTGPEIPLAVSSLTPDKAAASPGEAITWSAAASGGSGSLRYRFFVYKDNTQVYSESSYGTAKSISYTPEEAGTYKARVYVRDSSGTIVNRMGGAVTVTSPNTKPGAIASVTAKAASRKITVSWTAAPGATAYIVQRRVKDSTTWTTLKSNVSGTSYEDTTGVVGTVYQYRVRGRNGTLYGPFKVSSVVRAQAEGGSSSGPGAISTVQATATAGKINVTWTASANATAYIIQRRVKGEDNWTTLKSNVLRTGYEDTTCVPGVIYQYRVRGRNGTNYGAFTVSSVVRAR